MLAESISEHLALSVDSVRLIGRTASFRYKQYSVRKSNGELRPIFHPAKELKALQRWIADNIVSLLPRHECATAYHSGASIRKNAERHLSSNFLLRMDFSNFFPSLQASDVARHLASHRERLPRGWDNDDTDLLCSLCCRHGVLTIGAVSSPSLSNTLCWELDNGLFSASQTEGIVYSRYADDLFFSSQAPDLLGPFQKRVETIVASLAYPRALALNRAKTIHTSRKHRRRLAGVVLTSDRRISLGRPLKRKVRSQILKAASMSGVELQKLGGLIAHCKNVEPTFIATLIIRYGPEIMGPLMRGKPPFPAAYDAYFARRQSSGAA